jgi:4-hydroxy-3-methylbut-2-enyl diphosphate reductase
LARDLKIGIIDGTCPIVRRLQKEVRDTYEAMDHSSEQVVIFGKPEHPETIGLLGQIDGDAIVVSGPCDIAKVDSSRRVHLFSQTTMDPEKFREVENALREYLKDSKNPDFRSSCTICGQMKKRKPGLSDFAKKHDVIIFVSGRSSSNGKMLFEYCKSVNPGTYWISGKDEVNPEWLAGAGSIGISGATSTSRNQLESVMEVVNKLTLS